MPSAVGIPDAVTATEHSQRREDRWQILGVATAIEHSELSTATGRATNWVPRVISINASACTHIALQDYLVVASTHSLSRFPQEIAGVLCSGECAKIACALILCIACVFVFPASFELRDRGDETSYSMLCACCLA